LPKGIPCKRYTLEFKKEVVETIRRGKQSAGSSRMIDDTEFSMLGQKLYLAPILDFSAETLSVSCFHVDSSISYVTAILIT
jgi:hypothetical protein